MDVIEITFFVDFTLATGWASPIRKVLQDHSGASKITLERAKKQPT